MIHPNDIMRSSDADDGDEDTPDNGGRRAFTALTGAYVPDKPLDCGVTQIPCLGRLLRLERHAKPWVFALAVSLLGLVQGANAAYFRSTADKWSQHYHIPSDWIRWLVFGNEISSGVFALLIGHWGNYFHRPLWIGWLAIYHAVGSLLLLLPESYLTNTALKSDKFSLCTKIPLSVIPNEDINYTALSIFYLHQLVHSFSMSSFITHGVSYIDDHIDQTNTAIYIGVLIGSNEIGKQLGMYLSWIPNMTDSTTIFVTAAWITISCAVLFMGSIVNLFPKILPSQIIRRSVENLLQYISGRPSQKKEINKGFFATLSRLLTNKILLMNITSALFATIALTNFLLLQTEFYRSQYHVALGDSRSSGGYNDPFAAQILTHLIRQPAIALALLMAGLIIARFRPTAPALTRAIAVSYVVAALLFAGFLFLRCEESRLHITQPNQITNAYCNSHCNCPLEVYAPICVEGKNTYFSPCHAGCQSMDKTVERMIYRNCTCGVNLSVKVDTTAEDGACNFESCNFLWGFAQANGVLIGGLLAATVLAQLLITLRCVLETDKVLALALQITVLAVLPYVPGHVIYTAVTERMCQYFVKGKGCKLHSEDLGTFISITTVSLLCVSAVFAAIISFMVDDLNLYNNMSTFDEDGYVASYDHSSRSDGGQLSSGSPPSSPSDTQARTTSVNNSVEVTPRRYYEDESFLASESSLRDGPHRNSRESVLRDEDIDLTLQEIEEEDQDEDVTAARNNRGNNNRFLESEF